VRTRIVAPDELESFVGSVIGVRPWVTVDQPMIDAFADITSDRQWIHTDPRRAAAGPFGVTIAHGYLALSLVTSPMNDAFDVDGFTVAVNYGVNRVRFTSVVPVGSRLRGEFRLRSVERTPPGVRAGISVTVDREGSPKPACAAEIILLFVG
jgi:acyl dehydratase